MATGRGASVGAVRVDIIAANAKFFKAIKESRDRLRKFKDYTRRISRSIAKNWKGIATAIVAVKASIGVVLNQMADYSSALVEAARTTGMTVKQLEALRTLFQGDGIGIQQTDKAMQEFTVRVGLAQRGVGQYARAFRQLDVELHKSDGTTRDHNELLIEVAEKLSNTENHAAAASVAYELFGRSGKALLPILQRHGAELGTAADAANRYNTVSGKQHELTKDMGQAFFDLKTKIFDLMANALGPLVPVVTTLTNDFISFLEQVQPFTVSFGSVIAQIVKGWGDLAKAVAPFAPFLGLDFRSDERKLQDSQIKRANIQRQLIEEGMIERAAGKGASRGAGRGHSRFESLTLELSKIDAEIAELEHKIAARDRVIEEADKVSNLGHVPGSRKTVPTLPYMAQVRQNTAHYQNMSTDDIAAAHGILPDTWQAPVIGSMRDPNFENEKLYNRALLETKKAKRIGEEFAKNFTAGMRKFALADLGSMGSYYEMFLGGPWDPRQAGRGARLGGSRTYRAQRNFGLGQMANVATNYGLGTAPARVSQYNANAGLGIQPGTLVGAGWSNSAWGGFPSPYGSGTGRDTSSEDMQLYRTVGLIREWNTSLREVGSTFESRLAGAKSFWKGQIAAIEELNEKTDALKAGWFDRSAGGDARTAGAQAWWQGQFVDDGIKSQLEEMVPITNQIRAAFDNMGRSAISNFDNMGEAAMNFGKQLLAIFFERQVMGPASNFLFGAAGSSGGGILGGLIGSIFGGGSFAGGKGIATLADGGMGRGMALVGERGPELVDFSSPGRVTSNERIRSAMGGSQMQSGPVINITVNSTDGPGVTKAINSAMPGFMAAAQAATLDLATRPSPVRAALRGSR